MHISKIFVYLFAVLLSLSYATPQSDSLFVYKLFSQITSIDFVKTKPNTIKEYLSPVVQIHEVSKNKAEWEFEADTASNYPYAKLTIGYSTLYPKIGSGYVLEFINIILNPKSSYFSYEKCKLILKQLLETRFGTARAYDPEMVEWICPPGYKANFFNDSESEKTIRLRLQFQLIEEGEGFEQ